MNDLPNDTLLEIALHLIEDLPSFVSFSRTNKRCYHITKVESLWKALCNEWNPTATPLFTWRELFIQKVYRIRTIYPSVPLKSIYNPNYVCTVTKVEFTKESTRIEIRITGNMSLGRLQDPLRINVAHSTTQYETRDKQWEVADSQREFKGFLVYDPLCPDNQSYEFTYGTSGYASTPLFRLNKKFLTTHHLLHLFPQGIPEEDSEDEGIKWLSAPLPQ